MSGLENVLKNMAIARMEELASEIIPAQEASAKEMAELADLEDRFIPTQRRAKRLTEHFFYDTVGVCVAIDRWGNHGKSTAWVPNPDLVGDAHFYPTVTDDMRAVIKAELRDIIDELRSIETRSESVYSDRKGRVTTTNKTQAEYDRLQRYVVAVEESS